MGLCTSNLVFLCLRCKSLSVYFTHYHRESGLWLCVRVLLEMNQIHTVTSVLSIHPLLVPHFSSGQDLQLALSVTNIKAV